MKNTLVITGFIAALLLVVAGAVYQYSSSPEPSYGIDVTPKDMVMSGTYVCLPHVDMSGPQTEECAFGIRTDNGDHYAVNFGASAGAMQQFQSGAHITAEGFLVIKEALSANQWEKYDMKGIFTVTRVIDAATSTVPIGKLDIKAVCETALAYMSFPDGKSAEAFVTACIEGKHPEVIERYKADMNLGDGAQI